MENREIAESILKAHGVQCKMRTLECVLWQQEHENCFGCEGEMACDQSIAVTTIMFLALKDPDYVGFFQLVCEANTLEEVRWLAGQLMKESLAVMP
jgi:hypothetical protein